jgi:hypothetical protein
VGGVGSLGKVAPAISTNATHDERVPGNDGDANEGDPRQSGVSAASCGVEVLLQMIRGSQRVPKKCFSHREMRSRQRFIACIDNC